MSDEIDCRHVHILQGLIRPQACAILRDRAGETRVHMHSDSAVPGLAGGKLLLTLSTTNYFNSKHAKSFVFYEIKVDLLVMTALPNRSK